LGHYVALNLHFPLVRLPYFPFFNSVLIFLLRLYYWPPTWLGRIGRLLNYVLFVIIKLQFVCFSPLGDPRGDVKPDVTNPVC